MVKWSRLAIDDERLKTTLVSAETASRKARGAVDAGLGDLWDRRDHNLVFARLGITRASKDDKPAAER